MEQHLSDDNQALVQALRQLGVHSHPALIYSTLEEEMAAALPFLQMGLERGEKCVFIADDHDVDSVVKYMRAAGLDADAATSSSALSVITGRDILVPTGHFNPDDLLDLVDTATAEAKREGYSAFRMFSEMTWMLEGGEAPAELMRYEARFNQLVTANDCLAVCAYSRLRFDARTILDVMHTHPQIIYYGRVCRNPYFVPPSELLQATPGQRWQMEMERQLSVMVGRQLADEALEESERAYHTLADNLPGIVYRIYVNDDKRVRFFNRLAREVTGYSDEELLKCRDCAIDQLILEEDRPGTADRVREAIARRSPFSVEYRIRHRDGTVRHLLEQGSPLFGPEGRPHYIDGVIFDITSRVEAEAARKLADENLQKSEEKYRTLFEESIDVIFITSPEGRVLDMNPAGVKLFGFDSLAEIQALETPDDRYVDIRDWINMGQIMRKQDYVKNYELMLTARDGRKIDVSITATALKNEAGNVIAYRGIMRDITANRKLEQQLIQAQRMESIGRLAGGVAHDFNNYLTAIQGYIELAMMELPEDSPVIEELIEAKGSSERAADLSRQLLLFGRREHVKLQPVNLNTIITGLMNMLGRLIGEGLRIETRLEPELQTINADARHIDQVIMNLVVNARDAMPEGGVITIRTGNAEVDFDYAAAEEGRLPGPYVRLVVEDTGVGMSEDTISQIYDPFFSSKPTGRGTGLGLSVVYGIVSQHDGWIDVESTPGQGSRFSIYFPAVEAQPVESRTAAAAPGGNISGRGEQVLLVEDESSIRNLVVRMLTENGYVVYPAEDAEEALIIFEEKLDSIDVVFSDVVLPGKDGVWLVNRLRKKRPDLMVLLASGYSDEAYHRDIQEKGYGFMQKPYSLPDLLQTVNQLVAGRSEERTGIEP